MDRYLLECCVDSVESAIAAERGGADRLELCANLIIGGTTPSPALYHEVRSCTSLPIHVLLRPRFGDFLYTDHELSILREEARHYYEEGADGFVIGCLNEDGSLHISALKELIDLAPGRLITLHRAFDVCRSPFEALEQAKSLGIHAILTSGGQNSCLKGLPLLKELSEAAGSGIAIMAGGGVNSAAIRQLKAMTGIRLFHMSGKVSGESRMQYKNPSVNMGLPGISEYEIWRTSEDEIRHAKEALLSTGNTMP